MAELKAVKRQQMGTKSVRRLRSQGEIPGIVYGHGQAPLAIGVSVKDLEAAINHHERLLEVDVEGEKINALIKEVQYDALGNNILHVDLTRVDLDELVEVTVPILLRGTPAGAADNGVLQQVMARVKISVKVRAIPDDIRHSVAEMKVGDVLLAKQLVLPEGATLKTDPDLVVANVRVIAEEVAAPAAEGETAEPEVIGAKKEEEEGEEGAEKK